ISRKSWLTYGARAHRNRRGSIRDRRTGTMGHWRLRECTERLRRESGSADCAIRGTRSPLPRCKPDVRACGAANAAICTSLARPDGGDRPYEWRRRSLRSEADRPRRMARLACVLSVADADAWAQDQDLRGVVLGYVLSDRHHSPAVYEKRGGWQHHRLKRVPSLLPPDPGLGCVSAST